MIELFKTNNGSIQKITDIVPNSWVSLTAPTAEEILFVAGQCKVDPSDIRASLDKEEASRIEMIDDYILIIVDIPSREIRNGNHAYTTIPLSIIITKETIITVCTEDSMVLTHFKTGKHREFSTNKRTRFVYQILYSNTSIYLASLRGIDRSREKIEGRLHKGTNNSDLIELHELESDLVYFATSLRVNGIVLDKLTHYEKIDHYEDDLELLSDVIIENMQAIEMTNIYRNIIHSTRDLFAAIIDDNLSLVMKMLTSITIIMAIPTAISSLYGMNVNTKGIPFANNFFGFAIVCAISFVICVISVIVLKKKNLF